MKIVGRVSNGVLSLCAGASSFTFTLLAFLLLRDLNEQLVASLFIGLFALLVVWVAAERPNSEHSRAVAALIERLLAVKTGDLSSPTPPAVRKQLPVLASAVEGLFEQVRSNIENVHAMAMYDPVTSLPNRLHLKREGERILAARHDDEALALLFVDLDGFKEVNDSLGHAQGDQILLLVANRLRAAVRDEVEQGALLHPLLARLAGDEFTLLFPAIRDTAEAERVARRILDELCEPFELDDQKIEMGASIGIAFCPDHGSDLPGLMKAADIAMYHAKASGRGRVCVYDPYFATQFEVKARTERALRQAVRRNEFELAFLPQLSLRTGEALAGEALIRWNHPQEGLKLPGSFIGIAEESSLITAIGEWVAIAAADTLTRWSRQGLEHRLILNLSPRQVEQPGFFPRLRQVLIDAEAPPHLLQLEFTETIAMRCGEEVLAEIAALRSEGVLISIDDFGTGYSNLARMKSLPIDQVKLDASLIDDLDSCAVTRTIVSSVVHLVHGLGAQVVAEGVERPEQLEVLRTIGCDHAQGFLFAKPMNEGDFLAWLSSRAEAERKALSA